MTTTAKTTTTATKPAPDVTGGDELARVDPRTSIIETNVCAPTELDPASLASIRTHGVRQPVQACRDTDGNLVVRAEQRAAPWPPTGPDESPSPRTSAAARAANPTGSSPRSTRTTAAAP